MIKPHICDWQRGLLAIEGLLRWSALFKECTKVGDQPSLPFHLPMHDSGFFLRGWSPRF